MKTVSIDWSLYAILDKSYHRDRPVAQLAREAIEGGAGALQIRDKTSTSDEFFSDVQQVKIITDRYQIPLIVNDRVDIALAAGADGVHLGHDDLPFPVARELIGPHLLLGGSVHDRQELKSVLEGGPDYIGVGTIYSSHTKGSFSQQGPPVLREIRKLTELPMIAIGGITAENLRPVIEAGADGVAVSSAIFASDKVSAGARKIRLAIGEVRQPA